MDTFINKLNSTLNAANLNKGETDLEDLKDEILEDLEEEAIQAEQQDNSSIVVANKSHQVGEEDEDEYREARHAFVNSKPRRTPFFNGFMQSNNLEDENPDFDGTLINQRDQKKGVDQAETTISNLGVTNHMHHRINQLEKCIYAENLE